VERLRGVLGGRPPRRRRRRLHRSGALLLRRGILVEEIGRSYDSPPTMMHTDPPDHTRYRSLVFPGFRPRVVRELEPDLRALADELLDDLPMGEPVDVVARLAVPSPSA
jgi:cytochrome P450